MKRNKSKTTLKSRQRLEGRQRLKPEREPTTDPKSQMEQMERKTHRLGSHWACVEPQGKRSSQKTSRITQTGRRAREMQRTKDHSQESAVMGRQASPQTRARTNHEPSQEQNGTNRTEHSTVGITRGVCQIAMENE